MALRSQSGALLERVSQAAAIVSANLIYPNSERSGLQVSADGATAYLKLYTGQDGGVAAQQTVPTVTSVAGGNFDVFVPAGGSWPGTVGGVVWTGGVAVLSGAATGSVVAIGT